MAITSANKREECSLCRLGRLRVPRSVPSRNTTRRRSGMHYGEFSCMGLSRPDCTSLSDTPADVRPGLNILLLYMGFAIPNLERQLGGSQ